MLSTSPNIPTLQDFIDHPKFGASSIHRCTLLTWLQACQHQEDGTLSEKYLDDFMVDIIRSAAYELGLPVMMGYVLINFVLFRGWHEGNTIYICSVFLTCLG